MQKSTNIPKQNQSLIEEDIQEFLTEFGEESPLNFDKTNSLIRRGTPTSHKI